MQAIAVVDNLDLLALGFLVNNLIDKDLVL